MSLKLSVPSIGCASCIETIAKAIQSVDPTAIITGEASTKSLDINSQLSEVELRKIIAIAGHKVGSQP